MATRVFPAPAAAPVRSAEQERMAAPELLEQDLSPDEKKRVDGLSIMSGVAFGAERLARVYRESSARRSAERKFKGPVFEATVGTADAKGKVESKLYYIEDGESRFNAGALLFASLIYFIAGSLEILIGHAVIASQFWILTFHLDVATWSSTQVNGNVDSGNNGSSPVVHPMTLAVNANNFLLIIIYTHAVMYLFASICTACQWDWVLAREFRFLGATTYRKLLLPVFVESLSFSLFAIIVQSALGSRTVYTLIQTPATVFLLFVVGYFITNFSDKYHGDVYTQVGWLRKTSQYLAALSGKRLDDTLPKDEKGTFYQMAKHAFRMKNASWEDFFENPERYGPVAAAAGAIGAGASAPLTVWKAAYLIMFHSARNSGAFLRDERLMMSLFFIAVVPTALFMTPISMSYTYSVNTPWSIRGVFVILWIWILFATGLWSTYVSYCYSVVYGRTAFVNYNDNWVRNMSFVYSASHIVLLAAFNLTGVGILAAQWVSWQWPPNNVYFF